MLRIDRFHLGDLSVRAGYSLSIIAAGWISMIGTFLISDVLGIRISEEHLVNSITPVTVHAFVNLMALMGIFIIYWLQEYRFKIYETKIKSIDRENILFKFDGTEKVFCDSLLDLKLKEVASKELTERVEFDRALKLQTFKKRSHLLLALLATIVILSYSFLFLEYLFLGLLEIESFSNLKLSFDIFIMVLCIRTFLLVFRSITMIIQD